MDPELQQIIDKGIAAGLSDEDIRGLAVEHASRKPPAAATAGMLPPETAKSGPPPSPRERLNAMSHGFPMMGDAARNVIDRPVSTVAKAALPLAVPGVLGLASEYGSPAIQALARMAATALDKPVVGGGIGAIEGGRRGGVEGAVFGGLAGAAGSSSLAKGLNKIAGPRVSPGVDPVAAGMSSAAQTGTTGLEEANAYLDSVFARHGITPQPKGATPPPAAPAPTPPAAAPAASSLEQELIRRMEPDFNTQDVVRWPPKKGILRPDESNQGLMREAVALSKTDQEAAMKVLKALRQRSHVAGGP